MIFVTGAARSRTSLVAGAVHACGAFGGELAGPNRFNRKGMFENRTVVDRITKPYLRESGLDPMGQYPLPTTGAGFSDGAEVLGQAFTEILKDHGWDGVTPIFHKDAKLCLLWSAWHAAFPEAKWIIVRRAREGIVQSCLRTSFMRAFGQDAGGWRWWVQRHERMFAEMKRAGLSVREVWTDPLVEDEPDLGALHGTIEWAGLEWDEDAVRKLIEPRYTSR
jgi:hypothetical protein